MTIDKLPTRPLGRKAEVEQPPPSARPSALRAARAEALLQQIVRIAKSGTQGGLPMVAFETLCEQAQKPDALVRSFDWTMKAVETAADDLADVGAIRLVACDGDVTIELLLPTPTPSRRIPERPPPRPGPRP